MKFSDIHVSYDMKWDFRFKHVANKILPYCYEFLGTKVLNYTLYINNTLNIRALKYILGAFGV